MPVVYIAGFTWGLVSHRAHNHPRAARGWWLLVSWPVRRVWPMAVGLCGTSVFVAMWVMSPSLGMPPIATKIREETGYARIGSGGKLKWVLGDTEVLLENQGKGALKCSHTERLYSGTAYPLLQGKSSISTGSLRLPAEEFLAGIYCGMLDEIDHTSKGTKVSVASHGH